MTYRRWLKVVAVAVVLAALAASCGADDDSSTEAADVSRAAGTLGDPNLSVVVTSVASGFGTLARTQQAAIQGVADGDQVCDEPAGPRANPRPSQVEIELVSVVDNCLRFSYDVANFRSFVDDLRRLRQASDVLAASPLLLDYRLHQIESQWPIDATGSTPILQPGAPTGSGVVIAVIDSGIDATDPALAGVTIERVPDSGQGDYTETGHGTVVASVVASPIGGSPRGLAPAATLLDVPADLCSPGECGCDPCAVMTPAEAIRWASDNGADIISMSFGYEPAPKPEWWQLLLDDDEIASTTETIAVAVAYAEASGVAMTASAGNCAAGPDGRCETKDQFEIPAGHSAVIGVGATAPDDEGAAERAWYSTSQTYVELVAPGSLTLIGPEDTKLEKHGTSFASPFVTAAVAILIGSDGPLAERPNARSEAQEILFDSALDLGPTGWDNQFGHGQVQLAAAVEAAEQFATANPLPGPVEPESNDS